MRQLPATTKAEMMAHFDEWVTNLDVSRQGVEAFIADPSLIGHDYLNRYVVCTTSGSTGTPAILVHDPGALTVYNVLGYNRSLPVFVSTLRNLVALLRGKGHLASVFVTGGHFLGNTMMARRIRTRNTIHRSEASRGVERWKPSGSTDPSLDGARHRQARRRHVPKHLDQFRG